MILNKDCAEKEIPLVETFEDDDDEEF